MTNSTKHGALKIVTVNIPKSYLNMIQKLMDLGNTPSRSEYIRWAVGNQITRDMERERYMNEYSAKEPVKVRVPKGHTYIKGFNGDKPFKTIPLIKEKPIEKKVYY